MGHCCQQVQPPSMLGHLGASGFFPGVTQSPPSPSISCAACAGNQQVLPTAASESWWVCTSRQQWHRSDSAAAASFPGCLRLAWHQSCCWAGEPQTRLCFEAAVPGKAGSQMASVAELHQCWGLGISCSSGAQQPQGSGILQLLQPPQQVPSEGLNMEPDIRQNWLCQLGGSAVRGELHLCYPLCFCLGLYGCHGWRKKIIVPNPIQKVSFGFFHFFLHFSVEE